MANIKEFQVTISLPDWIDMDDPDINGDMYKAVHTAITRAIVSIGDGDEFCWEVKDLDTKKIYEVDRALDGFEEKKE